MKPPKDPKPSIEEQKQQLISKIDTIDLTRWSTELEKMKEYRKLTLLHDNEAADDFYIDIVMSAIIKSDLEEFQKDVENYALLRGGKSRGKQKTQEANKIKKWLYPLLAKCDSELSSDRKNRGCQTMKAAAIQKVIGSNLDDPRKKLITRARVQAWIDEGKPINWSI